METKKSSEIILIAAVAANRVIGSTKTNDLLWKIPADLQHFRKVTSGHPIIMGRKTYESIGRPLPGRTNFVLSSNQEYLDNLPDGVIGCKSLAIAIQKAERLSDEVYIIGGQHVFEEGLKHADKLLLTEVHRDYDGDVFFPEFNQDEWNRHVLESHEGLDEQSQELVKFDFVAYTH